MRFDQILKDIWETSKPPVLPETEDAALDDLMAQARMIGDPDLLMAIGDFRDEHQAAGWR